MKNALSISLLLIFAIIAFASGSPMKNILIVYGSFSGSTAAIADTMKTVLAEKDCVVRTMPADGDKTDLSKYDLVVIGSAIHGDNIHPDVRKFIDANRTELRMKKVAVFVVCITVTSNKPKKRAHALAAYPGKVACGLSPVSKMVFAGNAPSGGWFGNWMGKVILGIVPGDYRDWNAIRSWTVSLFDVIHKQSNNQPIEQPCLSSTLP